MALEEISAETPAAAPPAVESPVVAAPAVSDNRLRRFELALVLAVAFAEPLAASLLAVFTSPIRYVDQYASTRPYFMLIDEVLALLVLGYVLSRRGRTIWDLGISFRWIDIPISIALWIGSYFAASVAYLLIRSSYTFFTHQALHVERPQTVVSVGVTLGTVLVVILNPIFEEVIIRGYAISEVEDLTGNRGKALAVSVLIQSAYHLYQGVPLAMSLGAMFTVFSLYYVRTKRLTPIILTHFYFDAMALV